MTVHLLRMAVRVESIAHLREIQSERVKTENNGGEGALFTYTRNIPRRSDELANGGSIYWVVKRLIRVRQPILSLHQQTNAEGRDYCAIELDPTHIQVEPQRQRAFQGWRYFRVEDVPPDLDTAQSDSSDLPPEMAAELRELGLI